MSERLLDLLEARQGIVCAVGAGGKKTTLYRLAASHPGRIGLTATVTTVPVPETYYDRRIVAPDERIAAEVVAAARDARRIAFATASDKPGRHGGLPLELVAAIHRKAGFDVTFVKADGARMRWIKAPGEAEPQIPAGTATVIPVVSARVIGQPLSAKIAHRPELVAEVSGAKVDAPLRPTHLARLLASENGALRGTGTATVVPVINMVDDAALLSGASDAAREALTLTKRFTRVVLAHMITDDPVVAVIGD